MIVLGAWDICGWAIFNLKTSQIELAFYRLHRRGPLENAINGHTHGINEGWTGEKPPVKYMGKSLGQGVRGTS